MSSPVAPTFVLVPGAFHTAACYSALLPHLQAANYPIRAITLPSIDNGQATLTDDINHLRDNILLPLFESDSPDVVLVLHSYAGIPGTGVIKGLGKKEREEQGLNGGILGVVYMTAMVPTLGMSPLVRIGGKLRDWHKLNEITGLIYAQDSDYWFYNDLSVDQTAKLKSELRGHSLKTWEEPLLQIGYTDPAYRGRLAYIRATKDNAILPEVQDQMREAGGVEWIVREMATGHSPFVNEPAELAGILGELVGAFRG